MSRYVLALAVAVVVAAAPFAVACDALKKDRADAAIVVAPAVTTAAPATPGEPAPVVPVVPVAPVAPLGAPTPGVVKPVPAEAGKPADAGAAADAGKTAPTPTPVFTIPTAIPGFDAAAFKPPPGFPSTLPTFPPPPPAPTK